MAIPVKGDLLLSYPFRKADKEISVSLSTAPKEKPLFSFRENERVSLTLLSDAYEVTIDCPGYLVVEKDDAPIDSKGILYPKEGKLRLVPKERYLISDGGNDKLGYNPGKTRIWIRRKGRMEEEAFFFQVNTLTESSSLALARMEDRLEAFRTGITLDSSRSLISDISLPSPEWLSLLTLKQKEENYKAHLRHARIFFQPQREKVLVREKSVRSQNLKALRYEATHPLPNDEHWNMRAELNYQSKENVALYSLLKEIEKTLKEYLSELGEIESKKQENLQAIEESIASASTSKSSAIDYRTLREKRTDEIQNYQSLIETGSSFLKDTEELITFFSKYGVKEEIGKRIPYETLLSHEDIRYLLRFLWILRRQKEILSPLAPRRKRSMILFEEYGVILIDDVLSSLGFRRYSESFKDLDSGKKLNYRKEDIEIEVTSNPHIPYYQKSEGPGIVNINSKHDHPDYLLVLYKRNTSDNLEFLGSLVVEMKYRSVSKVLGENEESKDILSHVDSYSQFGYKDSQGHVHKGAIQKCILLYPDHTQGIKETPLGDSYIGVDLLGDDESRFSASLTEAINGISAEK